MGSETEPTAKPAAASAKAPPWWLGAGLAVVIGVTLRFIQLPNYMLPIMVGLAAATAVVLVIRLTGSAPEADKKPILLVKPLSRRVKRLDSADIRKGAATRLSTLTRNPPSGSYRRPKRI